MTQNHFIYYLGSMFLVVLLIFNVPVNNFCHVWMEQPLRGYKSVLWDEPCLRMQLSVCANGYERFVGPLDRQANKLPNNHGKTSICMYVLMCLAQTQCGMHYICKPTLTNFTSYLIQNFLIYFNIIYSSLS